MTPKAIGQILRRAITDEEVGLGKRRLQVTDEVLEDVGIFVNGDGRMAFEYFRTGCSWYRMKGL